MTSRRGSHLNKQSPALPGTIILLEAVVTDITRTPFKFDGQDFLISVHRYPLGRSQQLKAFVWDHPTDTYSREQVQHLRAILDAGLRTLGLDPADWSPRFASRKSLDYAPCFLLDGTYPGYFSIEPALPLSHYHPIDL